MESQPFHKDICRVGSGRRTGQVTKGKESSKVGTEHQKWKFGNQVPGSRGCEEAD